MLEAVVGEVPQDVQTLARGNVPVSALLDLREQPRLDQRAPTKQEVVLLEQNRHRWCSQSRRMTDLANMIPDTPVSLAFMASSYDRISPLPVGDTESKHLKYGASASSAGVSVFTEQRYGSCEVGAGVDILPVS